MTIIRSKIEINYRYVHTNRAVMDYQAILDALLPKMNVTLSLAGELNSFLLVIICVASLFAFRRYAGSGSNFDVDERRRRARRDGLAEGEESGQLISEIEEKRLGDINYKIPRDMTSEKAGNRRSVSIVIVKFMAFFCLIPGTVGALDYIHDFENREAQPSVILAGMKSSPDVRRFQDNLNDARSKLDSRENSEAITSFLASLKINAITLGDAAEAMAGLADAFIMDENYDAAAPLAEIAANLRSDQPQAVNPYAEVLIKKCEITVAIDKLEGLEIAKDDRSAALLRLADEKREACSRNGAD